MFRWVAAPLPAILLVVVAFTLVAMGFKDIQIGGILNKLFGKKPQSKKAIDVANKVPEGRVDEDGKLIPLGEPDSKGMTQAVVVPIEEPGLFDDPDKIKVVPPGGKKAVEIELPDGVNVKDVDKVIITQPGDFVVTVKDTSRVRAADVDNLLNKYGRRKSP